jgi:hypothetical protein
MKHLLVLVDVLCCGLPEDIIVEEVKEHLLFQVEVLSISLARLYGEAV